MIGWRELEDKLDDLGACLEKPVSLVVIGSAVCMSLGQPSRMTMDVDVWKRSSKYDQGVLKRACEKAGILFNPIEEDLDPDQVYLQLIEPGIVFLGQFDTTEPMFQSGNLSLSRPPLENIIASKMVRCDQRDLDDIVFLMAKCGVTTEQVRSAAETISDPMARDNALENMTYLECIQIAKMQNVESKVKPKRSVP